MSKEDREAFLSEPRVGVLGVEEQGRSPRVVPVWFNFAPEIGIWILSNQDSKKTKLLKAAGSFSICVQDEAPLAYRHVSVQGPIVEVRECELERDLRPLAHRYLGQERGDRFAEDFFVQGSIIFTMAPKHWVTADYRGELDA
ncbi:MAG: pyridoxamine 5'-phosphate oxidase family protein [Pseudomonadota bacterium]